MQNYLYNESVAELATFETPFADMRTEFAEPQSQEFQETFSTMEFQTPFAETFEFTQEQAQHPLANEYVSLLAELNDQEFDKYTYELVTELEDRFSGESYLSGETSFAGASGQLEYFTQQQAQEYFQPLVAETNKMLDEASARFSGNDMAIITELEVEHFFNEWEANRGDLSPAQENFLGGLVKKVKSAVKSGINLAKKGIKFIGSKVLGPILAKLKGLVMPLLQRVLKMALNKLPIALRPYAISLARKFLKLDLSETTSYENAYESSAESSYEYDREADHEADHEFEMPTTANISELQTELDHQIANLVLSESESEAETLVSEYASIGETFAGELYETGGQGEQTVDAARQQFIQELQQLRPGESPAPAIERFLPAIYPIVKGAITIIGRDRVINFLAGLLAKLVAKWVPESVSKPLAKSIIDVGARMLGFETADGVRTEIAYEAIANTIQETVQNLASLNEALATDHETATAQVLEAFEAAAANNFPAQYIKGGLRPSSQNGLWILRPRGPKAFYKKYTKVFDITIDPQTARAIRTFRGLPLANFLRDKLGLDPEKPIQARVHLYEMIKGSTLSRISRREKVYGLNGQPAAWVQFHPLNKHAATALLKEPGLGRNFSRKYTSHRHQIAVGQRFFYLEIPGSHLRFNACTCPHHLPSGPVTPSTPGGSYSPAGSYTPTRPTPGRVPGRLANSSDVQVVINFIKSEIRFNYYFSEEDAKSIAERLNRNDYIGAALTLRNSLRNVLHSILLRNVSNKVKIVHEMVPELYMESIAGENQQEAGGGVLLGAGKAILGKIVDKLIEKLVDLAMKGVVNYFKARAAEFKQAQSTRHDGVTMKIIWINIPGMSGIRAIINAIRGKASLGNLADLALPNIPTPEVKIFAGKKFD